jgi:hypothetical protein
MSQPAAPEGHEPVGQPAPPDPYPPVDTPPGPVGYEHPPQGYPATGYPVPGYPPYGYPAPGDVPAGYGPPGYPLPWYPVRRPTNGLAIASLIVSISSFFAACLCYGVPGLLGALGAVLGHIARGQLRERGEEGHGLALAGVIVGWIVFGLSLLVIVVIGVVLLVDPPSDPGFD